MSVQLFRLRSELLPGIIERAVNDWHGGDCTVGEIVKLVVEYVETGRLRSTDERLADAGFLGD